jgi:hypothetical protein
VTSQDGAQLLLLFSPPHVLTALLPRVSDPRIRSDLQLFLRYTAQQLSLSLSLLYLSLQHQSLFLAGGNPSAGVSPSAGGSTSADGSPSAGGSTLGCIFGLRPRNSSGTSRCRGLSKSCRGCCGGGPWTASGCEFVMLAVMQPGTRALRYALESRLCCRASNGRCSLW